MTTWRPEQADYDAVERWIRSSIRDGHDAMFDSEAFETEIERLSKEYGFPRESLLSFFRNCQIPHIKKTAPKVKASMDLYIQDYLKGQTILTLARDANYPPYLLSRYIVEELTGLRGKALNEALRRPAALLAGSDVVAEKYRVVDMVDDDGGAAPERLVREVLEAQSADPLNNPRREMERHMMGVEFECVLEFQLKRMGIAFETETQLRDRGTSRTPDVLLASPLAVRCPRRDGGVGTEWRVICWIDSKALFGDVMTHRTSVLPQAESYVHRFGPGLVLYWFGHAPMARLDDAGGDLTVCGGALPDELLRPDGRVLTVGAGPSAGGRGEPGAIR